MFNSANYVRTQGDLTLAYAGSGGRFRPLGGKHFFLFFGEYRGDSMPITGRDLQAPLGYPSYEGYPLRASVIAQNPDPNAQYLEVGTGMGEFIYHLVVSQKCIHRPIIIDPIDYNLLALLLEEINHFVDNDNHKIELEQLNKRVRLYQQQNLVDHRKITLLQAVEHQDLQGSMDVVVDNYGPSYWDKWSNPSPLELEGRLLKPDGQLIFNEGAPKEKI